MIKLCLDDFSQITTLEYLLELNDLEFEFEHTNPSYGISAPYLIVDGVVLDTVRSMKYIKELKRK